MSDDRNTVLHFFESLHRLEYFADMAGRMQTWVDGYRAAGGKVPLVGRELDDLRGAIYRAVADARVREGKRAEKTTTRKTK